MAKHFLLCSSENVVRQGKLLSYIFKLGNQGLQSFNDLPLAAKSLSEWPQAFLFALDSLKLYGRMGWQFVGYV